MPGHGVVGGGWQVAHVLTFDGLLTAFDDYRPDAPVAPTTCAELEELTGGMVPGRVWIVVSVPGEGRTTLLTQWAAEIANRPEMTVHLVTPREPPAVIVTRLLAYTGRLPLNHLSPARSEEIRPEHLARARGLVEALSLCLYAMGEDNYVPEIHPFRAAMKPTAVIIDDADLVSGITPAAVADLAKAGFFVLLSLPRHQVLQAAWDEADLDPVWARAADVILEVRHRGLPDGELRPGEAELKVCHNRWGHIRTIQLLHQAHYSRFVEEVL